MSERVGRDGLAQRRVVADEDRVVWDALEGLRDADIVVETRAYVDALAETRARRRAFWARLLGPARLRPALGALAAAAIAAVVMLRPPGNVVETEVGELRTTSLSDGSTVMLNTDSRIEVRFSDRERLVQLVEGQARFDVVHDASRPFRVRAGPLLVTAVGTAFDVAALPQRTTVTLIEGRVVVEADKPGSGTDDQPLRTALAPGEQLALTPAPQGIPITVKRPAKLESTLAWQRNRVDLNDLTLAEALAEVNRYSHRKIVVEDPTLLGRRVSGIFRAGDVEAVSAALAVYFGLEVVSQSDEAIVLAQAG